MRVVRITRWVFSLETLFIVVVVGALVAWNVDVVTFAEVMAVSVGIIIAFNSARVASALARMWLDVLHKRLETTLVVIGIALMLIWSFSYESIFFVTIFLVFLLYAWDSRILAGGAILALGACPPLLLFDLQTNAEHMAAYAYYFLAMTVLLQVVELWRDSKQTSGKMEENRNRESAVI